MSDLIKSFYRLMISSFDLVFVLVTVIMLAGAVLAMWFLVIVAIYQAIS